MPAMMRKVRARIVNIWEGASTLTECIFAEAETDPEALDANHKGYDNHQNKHTKVLIAVDDCASWVGFIKLRKREDKQISVEFRGRVLTLQFLRPFPQRTISIASCQYNQCLANLVLYRKQKLLMPQQKRRNGQPLLCTMKRVTKGPKSLTDRVERRQK